MPGNISPVQVRIIADDETAAAVGAATARLQTFQAAGGTAGAAMSKSFHEARGSAALLSEEVGIKLNRHLQSVLATSTSLGPLLKAVFPVAAAVGFIEVIAQIPDKLRSIKDWWDGITEGTKRAVDEQTRYFAGAVKFSLQLGDQLNRVQGGGLTGSNKSGFDIEADKKHLALLKEIIATTDFAREAQSFLVPKSGKGQIEDALRNEANLTKAQKEHIVVLLNQAAAVRELTDAATGIPDFAINAADESLFPKQAHDFAQALIDIGDEAKRTKKTLELVTIPTAIGEKSRQQATEAKTAFKEIDSAARALGLTVTSVQEHLRDMALAGQQNTDMYRRLETGLIAVSGSAAIFEQKADAILQANPGFKTGTERALEYAAALDKSAAAAAKLAKTLADVIKQQRELTLKTVEFLAVNVKDPLRRGATYFDLSDDQKKFYDEIAQMDDAIFAASHPRFELMKTLNQSLTQSFDSMFSDIALHTRDLSQAFTSMASSIAASILQTVAKMLILGPLLRSLSGLLGFLTPTGSQFPLFSGRSLSLGPGDFALGPPHAMGGPVMPNMSYMVGEMGRELFVPRTAGTIVPNSDLGGARIVNQVTVVNQTARPVSAQIGKSSFNGKEYVTTVILQDFAENGPIRRAFGGS